LSPPQLYALHPEAYNDIDEIREFIADDSLDAADRVVTEIFDSIRALVPFPDQGCRRPEISHRVHFGSGWCVNT
jgi:plasmid stabilization system protein ParE